MPAIPSLFSKIPETLLVPLASPLKETYWDALMVLYGRHQGLDQLEITKESLLDRLEEHLLERGTRSAEKP
ncbi:MAG: hypothetical protein KDA84_08380 [Planctomycetaceae bacterium]|nr:hypothetical protein [Planctomycetaceae bacterium]